MLVFLLSLASALAADPAATPAPPPATPPATTPAPAVPADATEEERMNEFKERVILFEDWVGVSSASGQVVASWSVPKKGIYGEPLKGADFYEYINHPELAEDYRKRTTMRMGIVGGGIAAEAIGLGLALAFLPEDCIFVPRAEKDSCQSKVQTQKAVSGIGWGLALAGTPMILVGLYLPHDVKKDYEKKKMADEYNIELAKELGIDLNAK